MPSLILSPSASSNLESTVCDSWPDPCASFQCMCDRSFCLIDHSTTASIIINIIVVIIVVHVVRLFRSTNRSVISVSSSSGQWSFAFCTRVCDWEIQQHYWILCVNFVLCSFSICDRFGKLLLRLVIKWWQNCNSIFVVNSTGGAVIYTEEINKRFVDIKRGGLDLLYAIKCKYSSAKYFESFMQLYSKCDVMWRKIILHNGYHIYFWMSIIVYAMIREDNGIIEIIVFR